MLTHARTTKHWTARRKHSAVLAGGQDGMVWICGRPRAVAPTKRPRVFRDNMHQWPRGMVWIGVGATAPVARVFPIIRFAEQRLFDMRATEGGRPYKTPAPCLTASHRLTLCSVSHQRRLLWIPTFSAVSCFGRWPPTMVSC
jgi:hypothetical protein